MHTVKVTAATLVEKNAQRPLPVTKQENKFVIKSTANLLIVNTIPLVQKPKSNVENMRNLQHALKLNTFSLL